MKRKKKRFSFIEIILAFLVISILPVLALSESKKADVKNMQSEAKMVLKQIYAMQKAYKVEKGVYFISASVASAAYPIAFLDLRIEIMATARYSYFISSTDAGNNNFVAFAVSSILDDDNAVDEWRINQNGTLQVIVDDAAL